MMSEALRASGMEQPIVKAMPRYAPLHALWGEAIEPGFTAIPNVLLRFFPRLNVTPIEFLILLNIVAHWWAAEDKPYPRVTALAGRLNISPRTVQRSLNRLRAKKLLDWTRVQVVGNKIRANAPPGEGVRRRQYDLTPLVIRAKLYASDHSSDAAASKGRPSKIAA